MQNLKQAHRARKMAYKPPTELFRPADSSPHSTDAYDDHHMNVDEPGEGLCLTTRTVELLD